MAKDDEFIILLLQIINNNGNVNNLIQNGYSYSQILSKIEKLFNQNYVELLDNRYVLTKLGNKYLCNLNNKLGRKGLYKYVSPELKYRKKKMNINEIYIPLRFKKE